jgi:rhodanese-related sulfurtransferase
MSAPESKEAVRMEAAELVKRMAGPNPPIVLDVRSRSSYEKDPEGIPGEIRLSPDQVANWAAKRTRDQLIVAYCT